MESRLILLCCAICIGGVLISEAKQLPLKSNVRYSEEEDNLPQLPVFSPRGSAPTRRHAVPSPAEDSSEEEDEVKRSPEERRPRRTSPPFGVGGKKGSTTWDINFEEVWGYVDVRPGAHMFYWLYTSTHPDGPENRPLILWLQGGPGASSCGFGNFEIIGPLDLNLNPRNTTWVKEANILFIDNPVGSGYSYVDNLNLLTTDVQQITADLKFIVTEVLNYFPELQVMPFYVFGESYGGKMGAHFTRHIYDEVQAGRMNANVAGFAMGNSWISPIDSTMTWGPLLYQMSLVDAEGLEAIQRSAKQCQRAVEEERWTDATNLWSLTEGVVMYRTHYVDFYNILKFEIPGGSAAAKDFEIPEPTDEARKLPIRRDNDGAHRLYASHLLAKAGDPLDDLMNGPIIRGKLGVIPESVIWGAQSGAVFNYQAGDFMKPVVSVVDDALMNTNLQVIIYQGQLDLICDTPGTMDWVQQLTWGNLNDYNNANRQWFIDDNRQVDMYVKAHDRFKFYWVLGAGHVVPADNGVTSIKMLQRILGNLDT